MRQATTNRLLVLALGGLAGLSLTACGDRSATSAEGSGIEAASVDSSRGHVVEMDDYTLQANVIPSTFLSDEIAQRYSLERSDDRGMVNLVVTRGGVLAQGAPSVHAEVSVDLSNLIGQTQVVEMNEIVANKEISYIGFFDAAPDQEVFRFAIRAAPEASDTVLTMEFEDQYAPIR
jgi:hypothetical protein